MTKEFLFQLSTRFQTVKMSPTIFQNTMNAEILDSDVSDEEIMKAIRESMRELNVPPPTPASTSRTPTRARASPPTPTRPGLANVADLVHRRPSNEQVETPTMENVQGLSEEELIAKAIQESKLEALSPEQQMRLAIEESLKNVNAMRNDDVNDAIADDDVIEADEDSSSQTLSNSDVDDNEEMDEDLRKAMALSLDPNQQENAEYRNHFGLLRGQQEGGAAGGLDVPIYSTDELSRMRRPSRNAEKPRPKSSQLMSTRIAAKFPGEGGKKEFFNEDLYESQLERAIKESLIDVSHYQSDDTTRRCTSLSPKHRNYSKAASNKSGNSVSRNGSLFRPISSGGAAGGPGYGNVTVSSVQPSSSYTWTAAKANTKKKKGAYRPVVVDGCNIAFQHGKKCFLLRV